MEEERHNALFDKKLSEEETWIRQGVKARRTRNEGRVRALEALRDERTQRRELKVKPKFEINDAVTAGKTVMQAEGMGFEYVPGKPIVKDFTFTIQRGDKIAIVGPNGAGKTTLVKLLLGMLEPTQGWVKNSPTNQIAFFDQNREHLNKEETVMGNVAEGDDFVEIQGKRKHVIGYLGDFLFSPIKCRGQAKTLSGGEQNRLLLARLFARPANVLVLDEPTNDLDIESLDVLENILLEYQGTVIIISHDREFIDNIATHCLGFEDNGDITINVGGYTDWLDRQKSLQTAKPKPKESKVQIKPAETKKSSKRSYKEQKELEALPMEIETLEGKIHTMETRLCEPDFHTQSKEVIEKFNIELAQLREQAKKAYARWEELDQITD
jgi:ATP-binding cassette subfamily F protein uup